MNSSWKTGSERDGDSTRIPNGFSIVEALVVSVIMAILAAVAIPMYTRYVTSQREAVAKSIAQSTAALASIYARRTGITPVCEHPDCITTLKIFLSDTAQYKIDIEDKTVTVQDKYHTLIIQKATF